MEQLTLLIIRHAEKPGDGLPDPGVDEHGAEDSKSLLIRGWQRAGAWSALFGAGFGGPDYPLPAKVYSANPETAVDPSHDDASHRPYQTALPLAQRSTFNAPDTTYRLGEEDALVTELLSLSGVALVAWEHKAIIAGIVPRIPVSGAHPPVEWPETRFDVVLRYDRAAGEEDFEFQILFPQLLAGDADTWP